MEEKISKGWISLYRKFAKWQWYKDSNVKAVFIHLVLFSNHQKEEWKGKIINRGQIITSREHLAKDLGLSIQQVRTCLLKLEKTEEIKIETTNKYSLITILNYDKYQKNISEELETSTSKLTNNLTNTLTSKNEEASTNKINDENIGNKAFEEMKVKTSTSKNEGISTNKITSKTTSNLTTNNNILINNNNNIYKLNYTKLNLLFNYLIYKTENFENFKEIDRQAIVNILKKLELYISNTQYLTEEVIFELQIQYWTISEIYFSPYKIYLNELTRNTFLLKYLQTKKYVQINSEEDLKNFIGYFITCLRKSFKKN